MATSCAAVIAQFFLTHRYVDFSPLESNLIVFSSIRVYKLTNSIPVVVVLGLLSLLGFVFGVYAGVDSGVINQYDILRFQLHS